MTSFTEILENAGGALMIIGTVIFRPLLVSRYRRWNTIGDETTRNLPGDERVPTPLVTQTLAVTILTSPASVWPWLAQIGQERGGMYSYELLENIARCQMHNADSIVPEWELQVGALVRLGPPGYPVHKVVDMEHGRWLLLAGADLKTGEVPDLPTPGQAEYTNYSWVFFLQERPDGSTRLITRNHLDYAPRSFALKMIWEWFTDPIGFVMTRKMLLEIKQRAEKAPV
ncbi:MAG: hypothetical protein H6649_03825 [Caldilineae bacterium]|nr:hypothetical protein [Anaerolineae bacterium]MCB0254532.1 hypothetical protein [Anaerolineae bacterium]MCB9153172.1 hypothetical protein [Caldilineae bacterium]